MNQTNPNPASPAENKNLYNRTTLPETGYVRLPAILAVLPVGKSTWWDGVKTGRFPQPIKLGPRTTCWRAEDIHALLKKLACIARS